LGKKSKAKKVGLQLATPCPAHAAQRLTHLSCHDAFIQGFGASSGAASTTRFTIELPLPSDSPADSAAFVADVLSRLPAAAVADAAVVCASDATAAAVAGEGRVKSLRGVRVMSLQAACRAQALAGPLVLVEPSTADVSVCLGVCLCVWERGVGRL
jgi:hypothetical protein